ncbi:MAG: hypothetical protein OEV78_02580 [Spirochaetia bacterium]|nr:hypothetical protein [Spirochaetia bacterium]
MKKFSLISVLVLSFISPLWAQYEEKDYQLHPIIGAWFGVIAPFPGTELAPILNTALGGGAFFRLNVPSDSFLVETGASYYNLQSNFTGQLTMVPGYVALVYKLPVDFALSFYFKGGAGSGYFANKPEGNGGFLPVFYGGFETAFPAGKVVNIGARFDYYMIYETWMKPQAGYKMINGHFFNIAIMVNFNTNP